jgi:hypothetical protein
MISYVLIGLVFGVALTAAVLLTMFLSLNQEQKNELNSKDKEIRELKKEVQVRVSALQELIKEAHHYGPNPHLKRIRGLIHLFLLDEKVEYLKQIINEAIEAEKKIMDTINKYKHLQ